MGPGETLFVSESSWIGNEKPQPVCQSELSHFPNQRSASAASQSFFTPQLATPQGSRLARGGNYRCCPCDSSHTLRLIRRFKMGRVAAMGLEKPPVQRSLSGSWPA